MVCKTQRYSVFWHETAWLKLTWTFLAYGVFVTWHKKKFRGQEVGGFQLTPISPLLSLRPFQRFHKGKDAETTTSSWFHLTRNFLWLRIAANNSKTNETRKKTFFFFYFNFNLLGPLTFFKAQPHLFLVTHLKSLDVSRAYRRIQTAANISDKWHSSFSSAHQRILGGKILLPH